MNNFKNTASVSGAAVTRAACAKTLRALWFGSLICTALTATPASADVITVSGVAVSGKADLFAAGLSSGQNCCAGDSTPSESPVLVSLTLIPGQILTFSATGGATRAPAQNPANFTPDGDLSFFDNGPATLYLQDANGTPTGISGPTKYHLQALGGVFLGATNPTGNAAPAQLSGTGTGTNFTSISPGLDQIFFIGDGLTGDGTGAGSVQTFVVPAGATRLFLGVLDEGGNYDNGGSILATINETSPTIVVTNPAGVPEPETWTLMLAGCAVVGRLARRRSAGQRGG